MSQPSVTAYFNTRKRQATDELRNKSKVFVLEHERTNILDKKVTDSNLDNSTAKLTVNEILDSGLKTVYNNIYQTESVSHTGKFHRTGRNISSDSIKTSFEIPKMISRARVNRTKKNSIQEGQTDILETFMKLNDNMAKKESKNVIFEKKGALSPKKNSTNEVTILPIKNDKLIEDNAKQQSELSTVGTSEKIDKKTLLMDKLVKRNLTVDEIKSRINKSSRLIELKNKINKLKCLDEKLGDLKNKDEPEPKIKKFEKIQLEVPISPQKSSKSPMKTPIKNNQLPSSVSPQRRLLFSPKKTIPSPVKSTPAESHAYQRYQSITDSGTTTLPLPYNYRFIAEVFRCVDTISAMLFNRKEEITFKKLKPAVQELLRRNFDINHLAQIKTIYPDAYTFLWGKNRSYGSGIQDDKYELVLRPNFQVKSNKNMPDDKNLLEPMLEQSMGPGTLLERRRNFYNTLLEKTKVEHEKFLLNLENPMTISQNKITRWHPEFDVETCPPIEPAELPQSPNVEKKSSAQNALEKAKTLFNCNTRMEKALQRLADAKMSSMTENSIASTEIPNDQSLAVLKNIESATVHTPPNTSKANNSFLNPALKGIPEALLERVRAKQAAKALEAMTRTPNEDKEVALYSRLPDMSKIIRNIFVAEKKSILPLEFVIEKLDNSYRMKLTSNELEKHIRLMCKLLPTWATIHHIRKMHYLKIAKDIDITKIVNRFEVMANDKLKI